MRPLKSTTEVYDTFGAMAQEIGAAPGFAARLQQVNATLQVQLSDPAAVVTMACRRGEPLRVDHGETDLAPDTRIAMSAMSAHRFLLGELNPFLAIDQGEMRIVGAGAPFVALVPRLRKFVAPLYRHHLRRLGKPDLINDG